MDGRIRASGANFEVVAGPLILDAPVATGHAHLRSIGEQSRTWNQAGDVHREKPRARAFCAPPLVFGGDTFRISNGPHSDLRGMRLVGALTDQDVLLLRYARDR